MLTLFPRYSFVLFLDKKDDEVQQQEPDFARRRLDDAAAAAADRSGIGDNTVDVIAIVYIVSILLLKCSADALCVSFFRTTDDNYLVCSENERRECVELMRVARYFMSGSNIACFTFATSGVFLVEIGQMPV